MLGKWFGQGLGQVSQEAELRAAEKLGVSYGGAGLGVIGGLERLSEAVTDWREGKKLESIEEVAEGGLLITGAGKAAGLWVAGEALERSFNVLQFADAVFDAKDGVKEWRAGDSHWIGDMGSSLLKTVGAACSILLVPEEMVVGTCAATAWIIAACLLGEKAKSWLPEKLEQYRHRKDIKNIDMEGGARPQPFAKII